MGNTEASKDVRARETSPPRTRPGIHAAVESRGRRDVGDAASCVVRPADDVGRAYPVPPLHLVRRRASRRVPLRSFGALLTTCVDSRLFDDLASMDPHATKGERALKHL
eukprot:scaffold155_cov347-Pavlova_lutheri.AAC.74